MTTTTTTKTMAITTDRPAVDTIQPISEVLPKTQDMIILVIRRWPGVAVASWSRSTKLATSGPVSTGMGDRVRV